MVGVRVARHARRVPTQAASGLMVTCATIQECRDGEMITTVGDQDAKAPLGGKSKAVALLLFPSTTPTGLRCATTPMGGPEMDGTERHTLRLAHLQRARTPLD